MSKVDDGLNRVAQDAATRVEAQGYGRVDKETLLDFLVEITTCGVPPEKIDANWAIQAAGMLAQSDEEVSHTGLAQRIANRILKI